MKQTLTALASVCWLIGACCIARAEPSPTTSPSPDERKHLQSIATEFRGSLDPAQRLKLIRQADQVHPQGTETLRAAIIKQLQPKLLKYRQQFLRVAVGIVGEKLQPEAIGEIAILRAQVQALRLHKELTKEMIRETGDPALARLKELLLIQRTQVLERLPELQKQREELAELGAQWELCEQLLAPHEKTAAAQPGAIPLRFEDYLAKEEEIAAALAVPMDAATRQVLTANERLATRLDPEEARCILDLNITRHLLGLSPLAIDLALVAAARDHSADMQNHKFFSHTSPIPGKESFGERAKLYNTSASAENIAAGTTDGAAANRMWWHSPGHMQNMLGDHRRIGVGRAGTLWTEMLGR